MDDSGGSIGAVTATVVGGVDGGETTEMVVGGVDGGEKEAGVAAAA